MKAGALLDRLASRIKAGQIAEATRLVRDWKPGGKTPPPPSPRK